MRYSNDPSLQAQQAIDSVQQGLDKAISSKDLLRENTSFHQNHNAQRVSRKITLKTAKQETTVVKAWTVKDQAPTINAYYANDMGAPDPEELSRQINSAYVAPLYDTDAGYAYQEIDKWTRPAANLANSFGTIGTGSATRQDLMNHINERKAIKKLEKYGPSKVISEFCAVGTLEEKQVVIDDYNKSYRELVTLKLSGNKNDHIQGYHDKYLEAGRFGRRSVAREQRN